MGGSTIWLVGMMGAGKTVVGRALAALRGVPFFDSDAEVERAAGESVSAIFARRGEPAFRRLEREVIEQLAGRAAVVALGGGAVAQPGVVARIGETGRVVYLQVDVDTLLARIGAGEERPLLAGLRPEARRARLAALLAEREIHYGCADRVVPAGDGPPEEVARRVDRALGRQPAPADGGGEGS